MAITKTMTAGARASPEAVVAGRGAPMWVWCLLVVALLTPSPAVGAASAGGVPPPAALLLRWQPLEPRAGDATHQRREVRAIAAAHRQRKWAQACRGAEKLRAGLLLRASRLFFGPTRLNADTAAIDRFMRTYVRGATPLLATVGEVFVPAPPLRDLAISACLQARQPAVAERFVAHSAASGADPRLRLTLAVLRLQAGQQAQQLLWLVGPKGGGARASLLRALASEGAVRRGHLAQATVGATAEELSLIADFKAWLGGRR